MRRDRIITEHWFGNARRAATRAALAAPDSYTAARAALAALDSYWEARRVVVGGAELEIAAGRLEDVSSLALRDVIRDCEAELGRRGG
jgi:hypothetical protein